MRLKRPVLSKRQRSRVTTALVVTAVPLLGAEAAFATGGSAHHAAAPMWVTEDWVPVSPQIKALVASGGGTPASPMPTPTPTPTTPKPTPTPTIPPTTTPPTTAPTTTVPPTTAPPAPKTFTGDEVMDMAHGGMGQIQVQVTVTGTKITDVKVVKSPSDEESTSINKNAFPKLVQETLAAQSADIAAVSGASYTSPAFKQSLQSALTKAGMK